MTPPEENTLTGELAHTATGVEQIAELARRALEPAVLADGVVEQRLLTIGYRLRRPHEVLRRSLDQLEQRLSDQYAVLRGTPRS